MQKVIVIVPFDLVSSDDDGGGISAAPMALPWRVGDVWTYIRHRIEHGPSSRGA